MVMTLGPPVITLPPFLVMMTSTFFHPSVAFGNLIGGGESVSSATSARDPFTPFCFVERSCIGAGEGDMLKRSSMSLLGSVFEVGGFPPPTCFPICVLAVLGRHAGPS